MLLNFLLLQKDTWFIPLILQGVTYFLLFGRMGLPQLMAFLPGVADWRLTKELFPQTRVFWRPCFTTTLLVACAAYLNPFAGSGMVTARIFLWIAIFVYECFLFRLYRRLGKSFGRGQGILFAILATLLPPLFITLLALNKKAVYERPVFKPVKEHNKFVTFLIRSAQGLISAVEALALIAVVGFFTVRAYPPRILAQTLLNDTYEKTKDVTGGDSVVTREEAMGEAASRLASMTPSREKFFPDHSQDKNVVVIEYVIGSDLEDKAGLSSANISQMIDATKQGSALTFVLETGGSQRWFTKGIEDGTYGRYTVHDGKLEKVQELSSDTCMSEPKELADFLVWAKENYPADRYILALWDHGGGFSTGYGMDALNKRDSDLPILSMSEIVDAIKQSGITFDIIGFDACLMQDIEVAAAVEPYADYLLASEEVEGGFGWFYTTAFGMLAKDPTTPSEDFGREIIACYDPYNTIIKDSNGEPDTQATLSFVDLPLAKAAYDQMGPFFTDAKAAIADDSASYANISLAGSKSYTFLNNEQVDLIDFLNNMEKLDYEDKVCSDEEREALINAVKACVLYRNKNSAEGVHGMALSFPVQSIASYTLDYNQFNKFSFAKQRDFYNDFFSIMAAQQKKANDSIDMENASFAEVLSSVSGSDYTTEEWYVEGFENYEETPALIDIPLTEVEDGYQIDLPEGAWNIIADYQMAVYQKTDDGTNRYLGMDRIGGIDANGHPLLAMGNTWTHVGGKLVCLEVGETRETEEGIVFTATTKALLNGSTPITLYLEWGPVPEGSEDPGEGRVVGYTVSVLDTLSEMGEGFEILGGLINAEAMEGLLPKGKEQLQPGDRIEFVFENYDAEGNIVSTEPYGGALTVTNMERIAVTDAPLGECDVTFYGVLTDVYQRTMTTERIEAHVTK